ncbi:MAG: hypothetical protein ABIM02_06395 [candidate division WOR-3 bacterium]
MDFEKMDLFDLVKDYIQNAENFDPDLAKKVLEFQVENIPLYKNFLEINGVSKITKIDDLPFFPVEIFKRAQIIVGVPKGYFESSGTTGQRSRVYYHEKSLELYKVSALRSFPFNPSLIVSLVPPFEIASNSSLSYMLKIFEQKFKVIYINDSFEIQDFPSVVERLLQYKYADMIFTTSSQLLRLAEYMTQRKIKFQGDVIIIETGGYKALGKPYIRFELYEIALKVFPKALIYTEYGMSEMFSQFYSVCNKLYKITPYAKIFTEGSGLLKVFDFANLFTVSALYVPDRVHVVEDCFDVIGRMGEDERGCAFTFR